jgi:transcriptional regulator of arginine metabolism
MSDVKRRATQSRRIVIATLLREQVIDSQEALVHSLRERGIEVTQATASRDLQELGAMRGPDLRGRVRYSLPDRNAKFPQQALVLSIAHSGNLVVIKCPPGAAQLLAGTLDKSLIETLLGTIAGDDTLMAISTSPMGGAELANSIREFIGLDD